MSRPPSYRYAAAAAILFAAAVRLYGALAWGVMAVLIIAVQRASGFRRAAAAGSLFAILVALLGDAGWTAVAVHRYFGIPLLQAGVAVLLSALVIAGTLGAALGIGLRCASVVSERGRALLAGCVWVAWESLVVAFVPHHPWASLAATQSGHAAPLQLAALLGQGGLSFAVASAGASLGISVLGRSRPRAFARDLSIAFVIAAVTVLGGWLRLRSAAPEAPAACTLATVDAGLESPRLSRDAMLERYESATLEALRSPADAVVWPESALPASPLLDVELQRKLRDDARHWRTVLIAGGPRFGWSADWQVRAFNSVYRIEADGPLQVYDKRARVPFAEYWPAIGLPRPGWLTMEEVFAGGAPVLFDVGGCRFGVLVCFEEEHPGLARELADAGANALLVLSNDAHLPPAGIEQQLSQLRLRAAESGLPVVRAANRGASIAIDRFGRVRRQTSGGSLHVPVSTAVPAPAVRLARLFLWCCWVVTLVALVVALQRRWRHGGTRGAEGIRRFEAESSAMQEERNGSKSRLGGAPRE